MSRWFSTHTIFLLHAIGLTLTIALFFSGSVSRRSGIESSGLPLSISQASHFLLQFFEIDQRI